MKLEGDRPGDTLALRSPTGMPWLDAAVSEVIGPQHRVEEWLGFKIAEGLSLHRLCSRLL
jgi:hypothetical protein